MTDEFYNPFEAHISIKDLRSLESDLVALMQHGYGELTIVIERGQVTGHKVNVSKKYATFKNKSSPAR